MNCRRVERLASAYLDGELADGARLVRAHVAACERCAALLAELSALRQGLGTLPAVPSSPQTWHAIRATLDADTQAAMAHPWRFRLRLGLAWSSSRWPWATAAMALGLALWLVWPRRGPLPALEAVPVRRALPTEAAAPERRVASADGTPVPSPQAAAYADAIAELGAIAQEEALAWPAAKRWAWVGETWRFALASWLPVEAPARQRQWAHHVATLQALVLDAASPLQASMHGTVTERPFAVRP